MNRQNHYTVLFIKSSFSIKKPIIQYNVLCYLSIFKMFLEKTVYNNWYLEKDILLPIKEILKLWSLEDIWSYANSYLKSRNRITIWEYILFSLFTSIGISKYEDTIWEYIWFFNEVNYLDRFKPSFKMLTDGVFFDKYTNLKELYWVDNLKHVIYFLVFFKSKKYVLTNTKVSWEIKDTNTVYEIDKQDFVYIELSKIVWKLKSVEIHSFYRDNLLNEKLKTYFNSLWLWFKKVNYHSNVSSNSMLIPDKIDDTKQNLFIVEKDFRNKFRNVFKNWKENFVIVIPKYLKKE